MNTQLIGNGIQIVLMIALSYPLGKHIATIYKGEKSWSDFISPVENAIYRFCNIDPKEEMSWKKFLGTLLTLNLFWFFWGMILLVSQHWLPLNPDGNVAQSADQAFNTSISFLVNCNLQHYSGESGLTYFTQLFVVMLFQFITASTGMAAMAGVMKAMAAKTTHTIGNFWFFLVRSCTRILLPLSLIAGIVLILQGVPMGFDGKASIHTLEGVSQTVSQGPAAAIVAIKQLGTNGGGFFGANSAHPLENPSFISNLVESISIMLIPMAMIFAFGFYLKRKKLAYSIFAVMFLGYIISVGTITWQEQVVIR
jgi:K+-transporting ATPase, A chain